MKRPLGEAGVRGIMGGGVVCRECMRVKKRARERKREREERQGENQTLAELGPNIQG